MTVKVLNLDRPYVVVGGRKPLYYVQENRGYNVVKTFLGHVNERMELLREATELVEAQELPSLETLEKLPSRGPVDDEGIVIPETIDGNAAYPLGEIAPVVLGAWRQGMRKR